MAKRLTITLETEGGEHVVSQSFPLTDALNSTIDPNIKMPLRMGQYVKKLNEKLDKELGEVSDL
jgi:hypothetical protein